jgi:WD40 repeat protein
MSILSPNSRTQALVKKSWYQRVVGFRAGIIWGIDKFAKKMNGKFAAYLQTPWSQARSFGHGLKRAWVSVSSVVLGILLFRFTPQAQDLFLEVRGNYFWGSLFWIFFYLSVLLTWALPVYVSSRWILTQYWEGVPIVTEQGLIPDWVRRAISPLLAVLCFAAVLIGQVLAVSNAPPDLKIPAFLVNDQDVILTFYGISAFLLFWWFVPRLAPTVPDKGARIAGKIIWWFAFISSLALWAAIAVFTAYWLMIAEARSNLSIGHLAVLPPITALVGLFVLWALSPRPGGRATQAEIHLMRIIARDRSGHAAGVKLINQIFFAFLGVSIALLLLLLLIHPVVITRYVNRALMVPFCLGLFVPGFTYLSYWSARLRASLVIVIVVVIGMGVASLRDPYDVRILVSTSEPTTLDASVKRWAAANDCELKAIANSPRRCPSPIIVSAAGGASRASFLVASVIGKLMDDRSPSRDGIRTLDFSAARILTASWEDAARLWDQRTGAEIAVLRGQDGPVANVAFNGSGDRIVTTSGGKAAQLWDGRTGAEIAVLRGHVGFLYNAVFNAAGDRILTTAADDTPVLWDGRTGAEIAALKGHQGWVFGMFNASGDRIFTMSSNNNAGMSDRTGRLWDGQTGSEIAVLNGFEGFVKTVMFNSSGDRILAGSWDKPPRLLDGRTGAEIAVLKGHDGVVQVAVFNASGDRIVTGSNDHTARLWDGRTGAEIAVLKGHESVVDVAVFNASGDRIVTATSNPLVPTWDKTARVWDGRTGAEIAVLRGHEGPVTHIAFNAAGDRIVTVANEKNARLWDGRTGAEIAVLNGHLDNVTDAAFNASGDRIVTTSWDETARLWDGQTGAEIAVLPDVGSANRAVFNESGDLIITSSQDKPTRLWDGRTGAPIAALTPQWRPFGKQLFAISGVSGGALAAVIVYAAMADGQLKQRTPDRTLIKPPCKVDYRDSDWFGSRIRRDSKPTDVSQAAESWRSCLQLISAGDFLSPVIASLINPDVFDFMGDRAAILEQAWERRYEEMTGKTTMEESILSVRSRVLHADPENWLPILLLNGTSVETGRRIITSDVGSFFWLDHDTNARIRVFRDAYDLRELFAFEGTSAAPIIGEAIENDSKPKQDIRLSTAATMSARFPIISPHGNIRNRQGKIVDRVVDGGYYENFGAGTSLELVQLLEQRYGLKPFIILVNNEPTTSEMECVGVSGEPKPAEQTSQTLAFSTLRSPLDAVIGTREARGTHEAVQLCSAVGADRFAFITVGRENNLSMSWWLSMNVQNYLDDQLIMVLPPGFMASGGGAGVNERPFTKIGLEREVMRSER